MKKIFGLLLLAGFVSAPSFAEDVEEASKHSWTLDLDSVIKQDTNSHTFDGTISYGYKLTDDWKLAVRLNGALSHTRADEDADWDDWSINHGFLRADLLGPNLATLGGGWDFKLQWRYYLPTSFDSSKGNGDEGFGRIQTRSYLTNTFGQLSLSIRNYLDVFPQRNAYKFTTGEGNPLWGYTFGLVPVYTLAENLTLAYYAFTGARMIGEPKGTDSGTSWNYFFSHELELLYTISSLNDLSAGVFYENTTKWSESTDFSYLDKNSNIGLRLSYPLY